VDDKQAAMADANQSRRGRDGGFTMKQINICYREAVTAQKTRRDLSMNREDLANHLGSNLSLVWRFCYLRVPRPEEELATLRQLNTFHDTKVKPKTCSDAAMEMVIQGKLYNLFVLRH